MNTHQLGHRTDSQNSRRHLSPDQQFLFQLELQPPLQQLLYWPYNSLVSPETFFWAISILDFQTKSRLNPEPFLNPEDQLCLWDKYLLPTHHISPIPPQIQLPHFLFSNRTMLLYWLDKWIQTPDCSAIILCVSSFLVLGWKPEAAQCKHIKLLGKEKT